MCSRFFLIALLSGCTADLTYPDSTRIHCSTDVDCPSEMECANAVGRCVPVRLEDRGGPRMVGQAELSPAVGNAQTTFRVEFTIDRPLDRDPKVHAAWGAETVLWTLDESTTSREEGVYGFTVHLGALALEGLWEVVAEAVDTYGILAFLRLGSIQVDLTPPVLTGLSFRLPAGKTAANAQDDVIVEGLVETGAIIASAWLIDDQQTPIAEVTSGVQLTESSLGADRQALSIEVRLGDFDLSSVLAVAVELDVRDQAGNVVPLSHARTPLLILQSQAPQAPSIHILGKPTTGMQMVEVELSAFGATEMYLDGDILDTSSSFAWIPFAPVLALNLTGNDGEKTVSARFRDAAWNTTEPVSDTIHLATGEVVSQPSLILPDGQTAIKNGDVLTVAGQAEIGSSVSSARLVDVSSGNTAQPIASGISIDAEGAISGVFATSGLQHGSSVALEVVVEARGLTSVAANSRSLPVSVNLMAPPAPDATRLRLVEHPASPSPEHVESHHNGFVLTGLVGAAVNATRIDVFDNMYLIPPFASVQLEADGSFEPFELPYHVEKIFWVTAVGAAGNRSIPAVIYVPSSSNLQVTPTIARAGLQQDGEPISITFTTSVQTTDHPVVTVAGQTATRVGGSGFSHTYAYVPNGSEPTGEGQAVVRVYMEDGRGMFAPGTIGTAALTMTLDFVPPFVDPEGVVILQNDPGEADSIVGLTDATFDDLTPQHGLTVRVYGYDTVLLAEDTVGVDGSFGPFDVGDNAYSVISVRVADVAGNVSEPVWLINDIEPPRLHSLAAAPHFATEGADITITFELEDAAHPLRELPTVAAGMHAATHVSGSLEISDGSAQAFVYTFTVGSEHAEGFYPLVLSAMDDVGNVLEVERPYSITIDKTPPSTTLSVPAGAVWNGSPALKGTSSDLLSGVNKVELSVRDTSGSYWDGIGFSAGEEAWMEAAGTTHWVLSNMPSFAPGETYTLRYRAYDVAGNIEVPGQATFTYETEAPAAPQGLAVWPVGTQYVVLEWESVAGAVGYYVHYGEVTDTPTLFTGSQALQGPSPIWLGAETSTVLSSLPPEAHIFAVTAVDDQDRHSGYSEVVTARPGVWRWLHPSLTHASMRAFTRAGETRLVGVGDYGMALVSDNGGTEWNVVHTGVSSILLSVWAQNDLVIAVGMDGSVVRSVDGGSAWTLVHEASDGLQAITGVADDVVALGTGGLLLRSTDAGASFVETQLVPSVQFHALWADEHAFMVVGDNGTILRSANRGISWIQIPTNTTHSLRAVAGTGDPLLVVGGQGTVLRSTNGGMSFNAIPTGVSLTFQSVALEGSFAAAAGPGGGVRSFDAGLSFEPLGAGGEGLAIAGERIVLGGSELSYSANQGADWYTVNNLFPNYVVFASGDLLLAAGSSGWLSASLDPVSEWYALQVPARPHRIWADEDVVVAAGSTGTISRSTDGGTTLDKVNAPTGGWNSIDGRGDAVIVAGSVIGGAAAIYSDDRGVSFQAADTGSQTVFGAARFVSAQRAIAVAGPGIFVSDDGGATWESVPSGTGNSLSAIWTNDAGTVVCVGFNGQIVRSVDYGDSWSSVASGTGAWLRAMRGDGNTVVAVGSGGAIVRSNNAGANWTSVSSGTTAQLAAVAVAGDRVVVVGQLVWLDSHDAGQNWQLTPVDVLLDAVWTDGSYSIAAGYVGIYEQFAATNPLKVGNSWYYPAVQPADAPLGQILNADGELYISGGDVLLRLGAP